MIGDGRPGLRRTAALAEAEFNDPQGLALDGHTLYVADRKNHALRAVDLTAGTVTTLAGTGQQAGFDARQRTCPAAGHQTTGLNSPWDMLLKPSARACSSRWPGTTRFGGWTWKAKTVHAVRRRRRREHQGRPAVRRPAGPAERLTTDGTYLYVADSETSSVRKLPLNGEGRVETLVGRGLFEFGDVDGTYPARTAGCNTPWPCSGHDGKLIVADTYNSKLKRLDPAHQDAVHRSSARSSTSRAG